MTALAIDGPVPLGRPLPAVPLIGRRRDGRDLYVLIRPVRFGTRFGWLEVPSGYVTDFASIPRLVAWRIRPLDRHAWAAVAHDWLYAVGEPGKRDRADKVFAERLALDGVWKPRATLMRQAVERFGAGGYRKAPSWWATENFADPDTGEPVPPPFAREEAFEGRPFGMRAAG